MFAKKFWIPVVLVLIGIAIGGTFVGRHIASQEPVKIYNAVTPEPVEVQRQAPPKPPPPGETAESGHWHGDEWHAEPHDPAPTALPVEPQGFGLPESQRNVSDETDGLSDTHIQLLKALPDATVSQRVLKGYVLRHYQKYPDCQEHEAVLADAKAYAEWNEADEKHVEKRRIHDAELDSIMSLYDSFREKYADTLFAGKKLSPTDAKVAESEKQAILEHLDAHDEQARILQREKPISPKPMHTH